MNIAKHALLKTLHIATEHVIKRLGEKSREKIQSIQGDAKEIYDELKQMPPKERIDAVAFLAKKVQEIRERIKKKGLL